MRNDANSLGLDGQLMSLFVIVLAAAEAAVALAIEKSLLFREKWRLHLTVYLELEAIKLKFETGQCAQKCTVDQAAAVLSRYGHDLPIGPREAG